MSNILIIYSTTDGHTLKICQRLKQVIEQQTHQVKLVSVDDAPDADPRLFDKIVIGASIRYGKHRPQVYDFIKRNAKVLESKPSAFFSVNVVARKPAKNRPETNPYMRQFRRKAAWQPREWAVFAGKIDYQKYRFWDRHLIRLIMWMTQGPTHPEAVAEFTDWQEVEAFAQRVCVM
ncbi:MAG: menaquinone-dependent protoporphyrinogen IX dehydrogenase [Thiobacillaceae bacterium]|jgi:menaquinone-dependent protoporphyrinogen oxidase